jgi:mRNA interferase RelE/StbE
VYNAIISKQADKQLRKLNPNVSKRLYDWIFKNLNKCNDPRQHGKALVGTKSGLWRYRVGDYRIIADINDDTVTILIIEIGHRRKIYE